MKNEKNMNKNTKKKVIAAIAITEYSMDSVIDERENVLFFCSNLECL
jgi:hypothetical protein